MSAQATWTGTADMELQISCPGGVSTVRSGTSGLSLEVHDGNGAGTCTVTIATFSGVAADVWFTLVIDPAP